MVFATIAITAMPMVSFAEICGMDMTDATNQSLQQLPSISPEEGAGSCIMQCGCGCHHHEGINPLPSLLAPHLPVVLLQEYPDHHFLSVCETSAALSSLPSMIPIPPPRTV
jgi:hypothetical protein